MTETRNVMPSDVAAWCRGMDCKLNGKKAVIVGWSNRFAVVGTIDGTISGEWAWRVVDRVMRRDRCFHIWEERS